jgi:hypothetical protein
MVSVNAAEAVAGLALVFFLPGFGLARATFPEWRFRGPGGTVHLLETLSLSLVTSVGLTIVVGFGLLNTPGGFGGTWSDPTLFVVLGAVTAVGLVAAALRGAFSRTPPTGPRVGSEQGPEAAFEAIRELDRLKAEERRLRHRLRVAGRDGAESGRYRQDLERVQAHAAAVVAATEEAQRGS